MSQTFQHPWGQPLANIHEHFRIRGTVVNCQATAKLRTTSVVLETPSACFVGGAHHASTGMSKRRDHHLVGRDRKFPLTSFPYIVHFMHTFMHPYTLTCVWLAGLPPLLPFQRSQPEKIQLHVKRSNKFYLLVHHGP